VNHQAKSARQPIASVTDETPEAKSDPPPRGKRAITNVTAPLTPQAKSDPPPRGKRAITNVTAPMMSVIT
jgi:hypothetical protein